MNKRFKSPRSLRPLVSELIYIIPFTLLTAHIFVNILKPGNYLELFFKAGYWRAFGINMFLVFLPVIYIKYVAQYFDRNRPSYTWQKLLIRFSFVFLTALGLEFFCATTFLWYNRIHILDTVYFEAYCFPVMLCLFLINFWYNSSLTSVKSAPEDIPVVTQPKDSKFDIAQYASSKDVARILIEEKTAFAEDMNAGYVMWHGNLTDSMKELPADDYFQISRDQILHRNVIDQVKPDAKNHRLFLVLKAPFNKEIEVTPLRILSFKQWWYQNY